MNASSSVRSTGPAVAARWAAGAIGVLTAHQAAVWTLHRAGLVPWTAYATAPTRPLGVPAVLSAAFWGGVWWAVLSPTVERAHTPARMALRAAVLGSVLPTSVGALLVVARGSEARDGSRPVVLLAAGLVVNALWGLAAMATLRALRPSAAGNGPRSVRRSRV